MRNHDELIQRGCLPWSPRPATTNLDVWHEYEIPLAGTFRLDDQLVLFTVVGDPSADLTVWAYRYLSADEAASVEEATFASVDELRERVQSLFASHKAVFALANDLQIHCENERAAFGGGSAFDQGADVTAIFHDVELEPERLFDGAGDVFDRTDRHGRKREWNAGVMRRSAGENFTVAVLHSA